MNHRRKMLKSSGTRKIGLALGGGAARGLAHIGVLEVLEKEGIPIDMIAGTSMGAIVGVAYAGGQTASQIREQVLDLGWKGLAPLVELTAPRTGFLGGRRIRKRLKGMIGEVSFVRLKKPFACVATDVITGEEVVLRKGQVLDAVIASCSLPIIFRAARLQNRYLVDGVLVNPVPVKILKEMGANFVIAVNVLHHPDEEEPQIHTEDTKKPKEPNIFYIMMQIVNIPASYLVKSSLSGADVIIEPDMSGIGFGDFHKVGESILQGELAASDAIAEIKRRLAARLPKPQPGLR